MSDKAAFDTLAGKPDKSRRHPEDKPQEKTVPITEAEEYLGDNRNIAFLHIILNVEEKTECDEMQTFNSKTPPQLYSLHRISPPNL